MNFIKKTWSRRDFLRAAGLSTAAGTMMNYMPAFALDGAQAPKRVVFFIHPLGSRILGGWRPLLSHDAPITADKLGPILTPLAGYVDQMMLVEGLDIGPSYYGSSTVKSKGHNARSCVWTGANLYPVDSCSGGDIGFASGHSIDREILNAWGLNASKLHTISIGPDSCIEARTTAYYEAPGSPIAGEASLDNYFNSHWGDGLASAGSPDRAAAARLKIYDQVRTRLATLRQQIPYRDRVRFDRHIAAMDALHAQLSTGPSAQECFAPGAPTIAGVVPKMQLGKVKHQTLVTQWFDLVAAAIRCDAGRIFGVQYGYDGHTGFVDGIIPSAVGGDIHTWSHTANSDPLAAQVMIEFNAYFAQELKTFMDKLAAIPEGDGTSALDNTLIVWGTSMSDGDSHSSRNAPFVLLGGGAPALNMGRYYNFGGWPGSNKGADHGGFAHNHLLVTILHALGVDVDHFGSDDIPVGDLDLTLLS